MKPISLRPISPLLIGLFSLPLLTITGCGSSGSDLSAPVTRYQVTPMVSDRPNTAAQTDANLTNPWGIAFSSTGPFWVANNHSNTSTIYNTAGVPQSLVVQVPAGSPTGIVFNGTNDFIMNLGGKATFIFDTESGLIAGWASANPTTTTTVADRSAAGSVYKGLALASDNNANFLYAADFHNGKIDRFDKDFHLVGSFTDTSLPAGFAPFGIQNIGGNLYVAFAKQLGPDNEDDQPGPGNGFVDVFRPDGTLVRRLISQGQLNSPWGMTVAPGTFGSFAGKLLVGNFGDGRINAYDLNTGAFAGTLRDTNGNPIVEEGLWAITFGNGGNAGSKDLLYFTAGPNGETNGLFGSIQPQ